MALAARVSRIINRFPRHWEADGAGKVFNTVVESLALELEVKSTHSGRVRHAHRLRFAEERRDILLLAGLHAITAKHLAINDRRRRALQENAATLADDTLDAAGYEEARQLLSLLIAVSQQDLAPREDDPDPAAGYHSRLAEAIKKTTGFREELDAIRRQVRSLIDVHRHGNGTIAALLGATAAYLYLEPGPVTHSSDGYWHLCTCFDPYAISLPEVSGDAPLPAYAFPTKADFVAIEENPLVDSEREAVERSHGQLFTIDRNGFDEVTVAVHVVGCGETTVNPMVVNQWTGEGVWFAGVVPDGQELVFSADGVVTLEGVDVSDSAYSFKGAVFADADALDESHDFVFGDEAVGEAEQEERSAAFAETHPEPGGFSIDRTVPHGPGLLKNPTAAVGTSRWRIFVQEAHYGSAGSSAEDPRIAVPIFSAGIFGASVFAELGKTPIVAKVGFSWKEREAFSLIVWIPDRFAVLDIEDQPTVAERLEDLLDRHRAAGIKLVVRYTSDKWTLSEGVIRAADSTEAIGTALLGTTLWPDGTPQIITDEPT
ncbi:MAG: hypothetical protein JSW26_00045 [Desulfobacterales bacterium]|nr:MAG: hypothetical protein JSW26_00045 [Desulfobacterales bacterium]